MNWQPMGVTTNQLEQDTRRMGLMAVSGPHRCLASGEMLYWCRDGAFRDACECIGADECAKPLPSPSVEDDERE